MKNWLPSLIAFAGAGLTIFSPQLQAYVAGHSTAAEVVTLLGIVVAHLMPSPVSNAVPKE